MPDRPTPPPARLQPLAATLAPIPPAQVWTHLTLPQQEAVRQALLTLCRHLLTAPPPEVPHDPS